MEKSLKKPRRSPERQRRRWRAPPAGGTVGRQVTPPSWGFFGLYLYDRRLTYTSELKLSFTRQTASPFPHPFPQAGRLPAYNLGIAYPNPDIPAVEHRPIGELCQE